jgi:hypothetical protein
VHKQRPHQRFSSLMQSANAHHTRDNILGKLLLYFTDSMNSKIRNTFVRVALIHSSAAKRPYCRRTLRRRRRRRRRGRWRHLFLIRSGVAELPWVQLSARSDFLIVKSFGTINPYFNMNRSIISRVAKDKQKRFPTNVACCGRTDSK